MCRVKGFLKLGKILKFTDYLSKNSAHNTIDWRQGFIESLEEKECSDNTISSYLSDINAFVKWFEKEQGEFLPKLVTAIDIRDYKRHLVEKDYKPKSVNRKLSTIRGFLTWAHEVKLTDSIPKIPKALKQQRERIRWLSRTEQHALLRRVERYGSARDLGAVKLLLNTGLRVSELEALRWCDITMSERKGNLIVRSGKGCKRREIPLNPDARSALQLLGWDEHHSTDKPIMTGQRGKMTRRGLENLVEKYRAKGLEDLTCHSLRHTFCKNLVDAGVSLEKIAALAGHESLDTTRRYCEPSHHDLEKAVNLIGEEED